MLVFSFFSDLIYFYINLYQITGDYNDNAINKYKFFTRDNLKLFEELVDETILDLKKKVKVLKKDHKDRPLYVNA